MGADGSMVGNGLLQRWFGPDVTAEWASLIAFMEDWLPLPAHTLLVTSLLCWLVPCSTWLKVILMLGGFCLVILEMTFRIGC